jgi:hypothetical protein
LFKKNDKVSFGKTPTTMAKEVNNSLKNYVFSTENRGSALFAWRNLHWVFPVLWTKTSGNADISPWSGRNPTVVEKTCIWGRPRVSRSPKGKSATAEAYAKTPHPFSPPFLSLRREGTRVSLAFCLAIVCCFFIFQSADAATYYVAPTGIPSLSTNAKAPGSLEFATRHAAAGSTVVLANGTYVGSPSGFTVENDNVTFVAKSWHGAKIVNSTDSNLWDAGKVKGNICVGMVFGPCLTPTAGLKWSGGAGDDCIFLDCVFTQNDGVGFGSHSLVEHCLFTDQWGNSFDVNFATGFVMRNCIVRRGNRANGDSDSIGNKEDFTIDAKFDGLIAYDNEGSALWFDTDNRGWTVENCTLFANHGGNNWYNLGVGGGIDNSTFYNYSSVQWGSGQDQEKVPVGRLIMGLSGTKANIGAQSKVVKLEVTKVGDNPANYKYTYTISPALPALPSEGDDFAVQQGNSGLNQAFGFVTEANPNGMFLNNVTYSNTAAGYYDHASGNGYGVPTGGLTIKNNLFVDDGNGIFFQADHNEGNNFRQLSKADISDNRFKFIGGKTGAFASWGTGLDGYPIGYGVVFDNNVYDEGGEPGGWAVWWGDPLGKKAADSLADLQNPSTFNQDHHSVEAKVPFRGELVPTYDFPSGDDSDWSHVCFPSNKYAASDTARQVNDDETPYIERAFANKKSGQTVSATIFGHTQVTGNGPYQCEVYDYSGRWLKLLIKTEADLDSFESKVPGYAVLTPNTIKLSILSTDQYDLTGMYKTGK